MRSWRFIVTLVLLFAVFVTLVHWHQDSPGQRCEICFAQNLPSIHVPFAAWLPAPVQVEWSSPAEEPTCAHSVFSESKPSRAPPNESL